MSHRYNIQLLTKRLWIQFHFLTEETNASRDKCLKKLAVNMERSVLTRFICAMWRMETFSLV